MTEFLVRHFVKDHEEIGKGVCPYGLRCAGQYGGHLLQRLFICGEDGCIGFFLQSISVMADAFNNLSDAGGSVIGLVGVKMAEKPADKEHPFRPWEDRVHSGPGGGLSGAGSGIYLLQRRCGQDPGSGGHGFQLVSVVILILSVGVKLWLGFFNRKLGKRIDSKVMMATAADAMGDVVDHGRHHRFHAVLSDHQDGISTGLSGLAVSLVVMWAGIGIARDTLEPLIGEPVTRRNMSRSPSLWKAMTGIVGSHDLIVHNYGPGRSMASIHAEVPNDVDIETSHEIIDRIERDAYKEAGDLPGDPHGSR